MRIFIWLMVKVVCYSIVLYRLPRILWINHKTDEKQISDFNDEFIVEHSEKKGEYHEKPEPDVNNNHELKVKEEVEPDNKFGGLPRRFDTCEGLVFARQLDEIYNIKDTSWTDSTDLTPIDIYEAVLNKAEKQNNSGVYLNNEEYQYLGTQRMAAGTDTTIMQFLVSHNVKFILPHNDLGIEFKKSDTPFDPADNMKTILG